MNKFRLMALLLPVYLTVAACGTLNSGANLPLSELSEPDSTTIMQSGDMRIGPLDMVQISVFGVEALDGDYQVDHFGQIKLPLIGEIDAKGYTAIELAAILEHELGETYLQDPDVNVALQSLGQQVTLEGSVEKPGIYPLQGQISLLQAVALGGGPSDDANPRRVIVFRQIEGQRRAAGFDLTAIRKGEADDPVIFGNDVVVVDGSQARKSYGEFLKSVPLMALFLIY